MLEVSVTINQQAQACRPLVARRPANQSRTVPLQSENPKNSRASEVSKPSGPAQAHPFLLRPHGLGPAHGRGPLPDRSKVLPHSKAFLMTSAFGPTATGNEFRCAPLPHPQ